MSLVARYKGIVRGCNKDNGNKNERRKEQMFVYSDNEQLKKELKKIIIDSGLSQKEVAERMECKPQQYTNIVNKENLAFRDVKRIANAIGLNVKIEFVPVGNDEK